MKATDILYEEHRIIMKVLECTEKIVEEAETEGKLNAEYANAAVDFFRNFADGCHHAKEEDRLFLVMQERGIPRQGGPIGVMLMEHDSGRNFVAGMAQNIDKAGQGDEEAIRKFSENARDFKDLLSNHINKEDQVLFPRAAQVLDADSAEMLLTDFKKIESDAGGKRHDQYIEIAKRLCERYGIAFIDDAQIGTLKSEFQSN